MRAFEFVERVKQQAHDAQQQDQSPRHIKQAINNGAKATQGKLNKAK